MQRIYQQSMEESVNARNLEDAIEAIVDLGMILSSLSLTELEEKSLKVHLLSQKKKANLKN